MSHRKHRSSKRRRQHLYRAEAAHMPPGSLIIDPQAELYTYWGYPAVMLFMLALSLGMLWYFRRRRWM